MVLQGKGHGFGDPTGHGFRSCSMTRKVSNKFLCLSEPPFLQGIVRIRKTCGCLTRGQLSGFPASPSFLGLALPLP